MDPMQLLLKHFEKAILVLFIGWLGLTVAGLASQPTGLQKAADVEKYLGKVADHMKKATTKAPEEPPWEANLRRQLDSASVPAAVPFPGWVMERRPAFLHQVEVDEPEYKPQHRSPTAEAIAADRGKIKVSWEPSQENLYVVTAFEVHRKTGDEEKWEKMVDLPADAREWTDEKISSRRKYSYKVVSIATIDQEDPVVQRHKLVLPDEERTTESNVAGPVQTKQEWIILPTEAHKVTDEELIKDEKAKSWATIKVKKWDSEGNAWVEKNYFRIEVGAKIGKKETIRRREIDFSTGAELVDCEERRRKSRSGDFEEKVYVVKVKWPDGQVEEFTSKDEEDAKAAEEEANKKGN